MIVVPDPKAALLFTGIVSAMAVQLMSAGVCLTASSSIAGTCVTTTSSQFSTVNTLDIVLK